MNFSVGHREVDPIGQLQNLPSLSNPDRQITDLQQSLFFCIVHLLICGGTGIKGLPHTLANKGGKKESGEQTDHR